MADSSRDETLLADSLTRAAGLELSSKVAGRFEILALIGAGGMGTVYKARDAELDEIVALKVLRRELVGSPAMVERFRQEVRLARRVTHRNVARAFDIGEHEGERFLTMEFVDGRSLADARDDRPMALARLVELGAALTAGLGAAHDAGVIHRDLKPDNILLARDGRVVITDFGIARATEGNPARTQGGVLVGTPAYMAPEQVEGREIDARADLFALGVILFELSTGRLPWGGDTPMAAAAARLVSPPRDARALGVGESLALLLDRCLARDPSQRPASAAEVASALRALPLDVPLAAERHEPAVARTQATPIAKPVARSKSVAVLPLRCAAGDDAYLAEGLAEDLVDLLSTTPGLRVKPRGAVSGSAGHDARAAGASLGVDVVVEGSLRRSGETLRVNVRVIDTASGFQLWAKRFDRPASEILQVSDEVAQATAAALTVEAPGAERAPADPRVLDLKLRARHEYQRFSAAGAGRAVELYTEASALAPDDATVAAALALAHVRMWFFGGEGSGQRAGEAAERALALAPESGDSYAARGAVRFQGRDFVGAVRDLRKALALSPANPDAHDLLGRIAAETGPEADASFHLHTAITLDPGFALEEWTALRVLALSGKWREADRFIDERLSKPLTSSVAWNTIARLVSWRRDAELAARLLTREELRSGEFPTAQLVIGLTARPEPGVDPLGALTGFGASHTSWRTRSFLAQLRAEAAAGTGDLARALDAVDAAVAEGLIDLCWLDGCPLLDGCRQHPRFVAQRATVAERAAVVRDAMLAPLD